MKKYLFLIPIIVLVITGCSLGGGKEGKLTCNMTSKDTVNGYSTNSEYVINYKNDLVESVNTKETVESENETILTTFKDTLEKTYSSMNENYGGYTFKVEQEGNKVISTVTIDYNKMNIEQFVKDNSALSSYVEKNKLKLEGIKSLYEQLGATCK